MTLLRGGYSKKRAEWGLNGDVCAMTLVMVEIVVIDSLSSERY